MNTTAAADIKEGYKLTKIGLIPAEWEVKTFIEVASIDKESLPGNTNKNYQFEYISLSDVNENSLLIESTTQVFATAPSRARRIVKKGDILMSTVRPNLQGFTLIRNEVKDLIASTGFAVISCTNCNNEFLYHYLFSDHISRQFHTLLVGSNYPAINSSDVKKLRLPFPALPEQQKIAEILSTWDQAIQKCEQTITELKIRNKGLAKELLTGKKRLKGFNGNWQEVALNNIAERITRRNEELDDTVVTISAQRGFVLQEEFFNKRVASELLSNYYLIHKGEFAYNKSYSNGYPMGAFKRLDNYPKAVVTTLYICFALKKNINSDFMIQFFEAGLMIPGLMKIAQEGGRAHGLLNIGLSDFFNLKLTIPQIEEQNKIAEILYNATQELDLYENKLATLQEQKKGLMQKLLTGEIRVKTD